MPTVKGHTFEKERCRTRDVRAYRCSTCKKSVRVPMRTREPTENLIADALRHEAEDCPGPTVPQSFEQEAAFVIRALLKSARPHPIEHPTMHAAWKLGENFLTRYERARGPLPPVLKVEGPITNSFQYLGADTIEYQGQLWRWEFVESHGRKAYCAVPAVPAGRVGFEANERTKTDL